MAEEINYKPTEVDEEVFFMIYHMNIQPSEARNMDPEFRKWLIGRFIVQKKEEEEIMQSNILMSKLGPTIHTS